MNLKTALYGPGQTMKDTVKPPVLRDNATRQADPGSLMHELKNAMYPRKEAIKDALKHVQRANLNRLADRYNWTEAEVERRAADEIEAFVKLGVPAHRAADLHTLIVERTLKEFSQEKTVSLRTEANERLRKRYGADEALRVKAKIPDYEKSNPELGELLTNDLLRNSPEIVELVASAIRRGEGRES